MSANSTSEVTSDPKVNAQFELYLKCVRTPVFAVDTGFNIVYMNQFARKLVKIKKDDLKNMKKLRPNVLVV